MDDLTRAFELFDHMDREIDKQQVSRETSEWEDFVRGHSDTFTLEG